MSLANIADFRVLVMRENWLGCTGLSAFDAFMRTGAWADFICDWDYVPLRWRRKWMKAVARGVRPLAVQELNAGLLAQARLIRPHLFFAVKGGFVTAESLRALRALGTTCYCFYPDVSFTFHTSYLRAALKEYDWIFTTKSFGPADLEATLGVRNGSYLPHAFDPNVHQPRTVHGAMKAELECDVSFIGGWTPKKQAILETLFAARPTLKLKIWGDRWERLPSDSALRRCTSFRSITGHGYAAAICCSKINLGLLQEIQPGASSGDQITSRTFHIPACGGLMLHERTDDLLDIFREDESCACYADADELVAKVDWLLRDDGARQRIAARGREVVTAAHSWDHRVRTIIEHYEAQHGATAGE